MDPNEALKQIRAAIDRLRAAADGGSNDAEIDAGHDVADLFDGLDSWLTDGGFLPAEWKANRHSYTLKGTP